MNGLLAIGSIISTFQLKGALRVRWLERFDLAQLTNLVCFVKHNGAYHPVFVSACVKKGNDTIIFLKGYSDINLVKGFVGAQLFCGQDKLVLNDVKHNDLTGYDVYLQVERCGIVIEMMTTPAHDLVRVMDVNHVASCCHWLTRYVDYIDDNAKSLFLKRLL